MKADIMAKRSSFGSRVRKRLSDITNSLPQPNSPVREDKPSPTASSAKDYIDHLVKEKIALMKLMADKNKIIELSGIELQKLRVNLQKMQLQNWNLAQSNSHMLAELNLYKGKLKSLQHELVCKDALLKAKNLELQGQAKMNGEKHDTQVQEEETKKEYKFKRNGNRRHPTRSRSMGHSTTFQQVAEKEVADNKRRCLRRQSANPKSVEREHKEEENLFEIEVAKFPIDSPMHHADTPTPSKHEAQESKRTSFGGRPSRRTVEKVKSYKELPLNIKMRR